MRTSDPLMTVCVTACTNSVALRTVRTMSGNLYLALNFNDCRGCMSTTFQQRHTHGHTHAHTHTQGMCCHTTGAILTSQHTCLPGWHFISSREIEIIRYLLNFSFSFFSEAGQKDESGTACCLVHVCMCLVCVRASPVWANSYSGSRESETAK